MNLTFLNPFLLFGLAAVAVPILVHRITQKKLVVRRFSAVRLILQSQRTTARPQKLRHLLLLALRILAVAALVTLAARPVLTRPGLVSLPREGARVLILDNSLSMGYRDGFGERFDTAKRAARELLNGFEGRAALISTAESGDGGGGVGPLAYARRDFAWLTPEETLDALESLSLTFGRGEPGSAFASAYREVKGLRVPAQIIFLSDMARSDLEGLDVDRLGSVTDAEVAFLRIGGPGRDPNLSVKEVTLPDGGVVTGVPARLEVRVSNFSDRDANTLVRLSLSGVKVDQKSIGVKAGRDAIAVFELVVEKPGWTNGQVALSGDGLASDDVYYFPINVWKKTKVLVVDGDPKMSLKTSESFFLASALRPIGSEESPFLTRIASESEAERMDYGSYDAVLLLNVAKPDFTLLASVLETGKPVFLFVGDRVLPDVYNSFSLAPWRIGELKGLGGRSGGAARVALSGSPRGELPRFLSGLENSLEGAVVRAYFEVTGAGERLLSLDNRDPLMVAEEAGRSKLYLFASSADLDWNDLPLNAAYLPLMQRLVRDAAGVGGGSLPAPAVFGRRFEGKDFEGSLVRQTAGPEGGPGIYRSLGPRGELRRGLNTPHEESDLAKIGENELKKKFGGIDVKVTDYREGGLKDRPGGRKEMWPYLLGYLLCLLALETALANRIFGFGRRP
jgi:hypothetical protein